MALKIPKKYSDLPAAGALTGTELLALSQAAVSVKSALSAVKTFILAAIYGTSTWAALPAASAVAKGKLWFVSNIGSAGTYFQSDGAARWYPMGGTLNFYQAAPASNVCATEIILGQCLIPANLLQIGDTLRLLRADGKSGTTNTLTTRVRLGTAGTIADASLVATGGLTAPQKLLAASCDFSLLTATSIQKIGQPGAGTNSYTGATVAVSDGAVTIPDAAANALYLSLSALSNGNTDTMTLQTMIVQILSKP